MKTGIIFIISFFIVTSGIAQWSLKTSGTTSNLEDVHFPSSTIGYAVGEAGTILKSTDAGETWTAVTSGTNNYLHGVYFLDVNVGFAVGDDIMIKTSDGGVSWNPVSLPVTVDFKDVEFIDNLVGFCVGYNGTILKTTDGGITWVQKNSDCDRYLAKIHFPSPNVGYAVSKGYNSNFIKTTDGGETWMNDTIDANLVYGSFEGVYFIDENSGIIGSWYISGLVKTADGGANWSDVSGASTPDIYSIDFANDQVGFAVGLSGLVLTTTDGGNNWTPETVASAGTLNTVLALNATDVIAVGEGGVIIKNSNATSGLKKLELNASIYPNPIHEQCTVLLTEESIQSINVIDLSGKLVHHFDGNNSSSQTIGLSDLINGIYLIHIHTQIGVLVKKVEIQ